MAPKTPKAPKRNKNKVQADKSVVASPVQTSSNPYQAMRKKLAQDTGLDSLLAGEAIEKIFEENSEYRSMIDQINARVTASLASSSEETHKSNATAKVIYTQATGNMIELKSGKGRFKWLKLDTLPDEAREKKKAQLVSVVNKLTEALRYVEKPLSQMNAQVFGQMQQTEQKESSKSKATSSTELSLYRKIYYARVVAFSRLQQERNFAHDAEIVIWLHGPDSFRYYISKHLIKVLCEDALNQESKIKTTNFPAGQLEEAESKIKPDAEAKLARAFDALLASAYWDFDYNGKVELLVKVYQDNIKKDKPKVESTISQSNSTKDERKAPPSSQKASQASAEVSLSDVLSGGLVRFASGGTLQAAQDIKGGQLVFRERMVAYKPGKANICAHCYKWTGLLITPCPKCTSTSFCSDECVSEATSSHQPMCQQSISLNKSQFLAYRMLATDQAIFGELNKHKGDWQKLYQTYIEKASNVKLHLFSAVAVLAKARALSDSKLKLNDSHNRNLIVCAIQLAQLLKAKIYKDKELKELTKLVYRVTWLVEHSPQMLWPLSERANNGQPLKGKQYGSGVGPFGANLNYTCVPNLNRVFNPQSGQLEYYAREDIKSGDELTLFWNVGHISLSFFEAYRRRDAIKRYYHQDCACNICAKLLSFNPYPKQQRTNKTAIRTQDDIRFRPTSLGPRFVQKRRSSY